MHTCQLDEENALAFLKRAAPVICNAGILPATLTLLDSIAANPNAYNMGNRADLAALAAEWVGPYQSEGIPGGLETPKTVRELVLACLETDADGNFEFGFRTYASDDSEHWNLKGTPLEGVPAFGLYVIREGEQTYLCSMTPSSRADFLQNVFAYPDQDGLPTVNAYGQTAIQAFMDGEGAAFEYQNDDPSSYFGYFGDRAALDKREAEKGDVSSRYEFDVSALEVDLSTLDGFAASPADPREDDPFEDWATCQAAFYKSAADSAWENANEYFRGNHTEPRIIWQATPEPAEA